jgi:hypothetical protein
MNNFYSYVGRVFAVYANLYTDGSQDCCQCCTCCCCCSIDDVVQYGAYNNVFYLKNLLKATRSVQLCILHVTYLCTD